MKQCNMNLFDFNKWLRGASAQCVCSTIHITSPKPYGNVNAIGMQMS